MSLREKLPLGIPIDTVQTSGLPPIEHDVSGIVSKRLIKHRVRVPFTSDYVSVMAPATATRDECLEKHYKEQDLAEANARVDANKRKGELLDTTDPLPLTDFGAIKGVLIGIPLGAFSLALAWGIAKGGVALFTWILIGMEILPLGETW